MPTLTESEEEIGEFTSTNETVSKDDAMANDAVPDAVSGEPWSEQAQDTPFPDVLTHLARNGMRFTSIPFWCGRDDQRKLVKNLSVYFSVDTVVTSQNILEAFDAAEIDIDTITSIQWRASNRSWIVSFDSQLAKETALEAASIEIGGATVFLGDCENRLVLVKIYEAPNELPDTALIGRLCYYGRVLSFRRDKIAQFIDNGVRTARMTLTRHIPNIINVAGEIIRIWYPNQPKTCRNCGSPDHLVKDCDSTRCFNCEKPGHRTNQCEEVRKCSVCLAEDHQIAGCPFVIHSANVENKKSEPKGEASAKAGEKKPDDPERKKKQQQRREELKKKQEEEASKQRAQMQMQEKKRREEQKPQDKASGDERVDKAPDREQQQRDHEHKHPSRNDRESDRERRDRHDYERWKDAQRREKERERDRDDRHRHRDRDYERPRRDYRRDWSKRRDSSDDDDPGWTRVRRKRYEYD